MDNHWIWQKKKKGKMEPLGLHILAEESMFMTPKLKDTEEHFWKKSEFSFQLIL